MLVLNCGDQSMTFLDLFIIRKKVVLVNFHGYDPKKLSIVQYNTI